MELTAKLLSLDRAIAAYGPEAMPMRSELKTMVAKMVEDI